MTVKAEVKRGRDKQWRVKLVYSHAPNLSLDEVYKSDPSGVRGAKRLLTRLNISAKIYVLGSNDKIISIH